jgi:membrane associated rhomboid family serine protease
MVARPLLVTQTIIGINVVVFFVTAGYTAHGNTLMARLVEFGPLVANNGEWWRVITAGFVHFSILHILFNMFILYQIGLVLEPAIGPLRFSSIYMASLLAGSLGAMILDPLVASGGASGAVFGVGAAATYALSRRGVRFWDTGFGPLLLFNLGLGFVVSNVSVGAHIGGLIGGVICAAAMIRPSHSRHGPLTGYLIVFLVAVGSFAATLAVASMKVP